MEEAIVKRDGGQDPCYMMGWEGVYGLLITLLIIMPSQILGCPFDDESKCVNGHIDDMQLAQNQMSGNHLLVVLALGFIGAAALFNGFGATTTKLTSSANRVVVEQSRVVVIWIFFLLYPGEGHESF